MTSYNPVAVRLKAAAPVARLYTHLDICAGIGGFSLAFERHGFRTVGQIENDEFCTRVLAKHWPDAPRFGDVRGCTGRHGKGWKRYQQLPAADVITAGFPCQPFSLAGSRLGERDERYLWPEIARIISEVKPKVVLLENVPGLRTIDNGGTFKRVVEALAAFGYIVEWTIVPAAAVGAPHLRNRIYIMAYAPCAGTEPAEQSGQRNSTVPCGNSMAYADGLGRQGSGTRQSASDQHREYPPQLRRRQDQLHATQPSGATLADSHGERRQGQRGTVSIQSQLAGAECPGREVTQPGMGRVLDGLPAGLDSIGRSTQWPSRPGEAQAEWEAPRVATQVAYRTKRIKALGNSVCVPVVEAFAKLIYSYLEATL